MDPLSIVNKLRGITSGKVNMTTDNPLTGPLSVTTEIDKLLQHI